MYTNTSCTIYLASSGYKSVFIPHCFLTQRMNATYSKPGLSYAESCFVMFICDELKFTEGKDFLVEGQCEMVIDNSTEKAFSDSMKKLQEYNPSTIMTADRKRYGSGSMRHYEISCK